MSRGGSDSVWMKVYWSGYSSFSDARERSKESFSESEPVRCFPAHMPEKTARTDFSHASRFLNAHIAPFAQHRRFRGFFTCSLWHRSKSSGIRGAKIQSKIRATIISIANRNKYVSFFLFWICFLEFGDVSWIYKSQLVWLEKKC
jgi:hypothetical protein